MKIFNFDFQRFSKNNFEASTGSFSLCVVSDGIGEETVEKFVNFDFGRVWRSGSQNIQKP